MDEKRIRRQTAVLLDAYRELTGSDAIPELDEFLRLRQEAITETKLGIRDKEDILQANPEPKIAKNAPQPEAQRQKKPPAPTDRKPPAEQPVKPIHTQIEDPLGEQEEKPEKENSPFAVLRAIQDPWNA